MTYSLPFLTHWCMCLFWACILRNCTTAIGQFPFRLVVVAEQQYPLHSELSQNPPFEPQDFQQSLKSDLICPVDTKWKKGLCKTKNKASKADHAIKRLNTSNFQFLLFYSKIDLYILGNIRVCIRFALNSSSNFEIRGFRSYLLWKNRRLLQSGILRNLDVCIFGSRISRHDFGLFGPILRSPLSLESHAGWAWSPPRPPNMTVSKIGRAVHQGKLQNMTKFSEKYLRAEKWSE